MSRFYSFGVYMFKNMFLCKKKWLHKFEIIYHENKSSFDTKKAQLLHYIS